MKFSVTAPDRSSMGFSTYCCAGRHWPGGKPVTVEVVDQDECPRIPHPTRTDVKMLDPVRIGRNAWKEIQEDPMLSKNQVSDDAELTLPPANPTEQLKEENRKLKERLTALEGGLHDLGASIESRFAALHATLAEAMVKRDAAPAPAAEETPAPAAQPSEPQATETENPAAPAAETPPAQPIPSRNRRGKGG